MTRLFLSHINTSNITLIKGRFMKEIILTQTDLISGLIAGVILGIVYYYLLWQTLSIIKKSKKPQIVLFISDALRVFLLIMVMLLICEKNPAKFLLVFCVFFLTRYILFKISNPKLKKQMSAGEIVYHGNVKTISKNKVKTRKKRK